MSKQFIVGSRKSQLAIVQTNTVIDLLQQNHNGLLFEVVTMTTTGDKILDTALSQIGEKSLFTKELENSLLDGQVDFVVHSLKDLPTVLPKGLIIAGICRRDDPSDVCVMAKRNVGNSLATLPNGSTVGTSSLRRAAQLRQKYPHLTVIDIRGNLNTRLKKLDETGDYDAIILAQAGLDRLGWQDRISEVLDPKEFLYAVSQGAMAIECRAGDERVINLLASITDSPTLLRCTAERAMLQKLEGGCHVPVAVVSEIQDQQLMLQGAVFSLNGDKAVVQKSQTVISCKQNCEVSSEPFIGIVSTQLSSSTMQAAVTLGYEVAELLLLNGAHDILTAAKEQTQAKIASHRPVLNH